MKDLKRNNNRQIQEDLFNNLMFHQRKIKNKNKKAKDRHHLELHKNSLPKTNFS